MESFFSSLKTERTARKMYRSRDEAKADVFDYIERVYNPKRRHSTIGYTSTMEFERQAGLNGCQSIRAQASPHIVRSVMADINRFMAFLSSQQNARNF